MYLLRCSRCLDRVVPYPQFDIFGRESSDPDVQYTRFFDSVKNKKYVRNKRLFITIREDCSLVECYTE